MNDSELDAILKQMATGHWPQLPSPGLIWFRAQIVRKARQRERIERPVGGDTLPRLAHLRSDPPCICCRKLEASAGRNGPPKLVRHATASSDSRRFARIWGNPSPVASKAVKNITVRRLILAFD